MELCIMISIFKFYFTLSGIFSLHFFKLSLDDEDKIYK